MQRARKGRFGQSSTKRFDKGFEFSTRRRSFERIGQKEHRWAFVRECRSTTFKRSCRFSTDADSARFTAVDWLNPLA